MALPPAATDRQLRHRRQFDVQIFARGSQLWEVEARLTDHKSRDVRLANEIRAVGTPIHEMLLRLVVDERFNIVEAGSQTIWMPYPGHCDQQPDPYVRLVGLNLVKGFRHAVNERLGGVRGCTHLSELCRVIPTAVVQAFAGDVLDTQAEGPSGEPPFQIDRCQALRVDGPVVEQHYPRWFKRPVAATPPAAEQNPALPIPQFPPQETCP